MERADKLNRLKTAIKSGNPELIENAFEEIRTKGDETFIAPLVAFVGQNKSKEIQDGIFQIFADLKHDPSAEQLVQAMKEEKDPDILERLAASCWQNGLKYSQHLEFFVSLILEKDFQIAFEAFTVVENMFGRIDGDVEEALLERLNNALPLAEERKAHLLRGLIDIIPNIPLDQDPVDF